MNILEPKAGDRFTVTYRCTSPRHKVVSTTDCMVEYECAGRWNEVIRDEWQASFTRVVERGGKIEEGK